MVARAKLPGAAAGLLAACVALTATVDGQTGPAVVPLAITGATVISGSGGPPMPNHTVLIEGARIAAVGPSGTVAVPANARIVNAAGKFVVPGFIDSHAQWRGWTGELFLNHGVTSIIDAGTGATDWILAARDAEVGGRIRGPRIFTAAGAVNRGTAVPSVAEAAWPRATVRALLIKGPDIVKVMGDFAPEDLRAVTDEAHKVGVPVVAELTDAHAAIEGGVDVIARLAGPGATLMTAVKHKEHLEGKVASPYAWMERAGIEALVGRMIARGTYLIPALIADHGAAIPQARRFEIEDYDLLTRPELRYVPLTSTLASLTFWRTARSSSAALGPSPFMASVSPQAQEEFRRGFANAKDFTRHFAVAGGRILTGTGGGGAASVPGLSLHQELELLVDAGLTPMQALVSATRTPAEMIKKDDKLGTIAAGKLADLVILDADPLADIQNTRKINAVVKNGQVIDTSYHRDYHTEYADVEGAGLADAAHPVPVITDVISVTLNQMSQVIHDGSPFEIIVRGHDFVSSSLVEMNGRPLDTAFISRMELRGKVPTARIPVEGTYSVTVLTPWPGGGRSNVKALAVK